MKHSIIATCLALAAAAPAVAQVAVCRGAEEDLSEVSVGIVQAYNSMDFDKARDIGKKVMANIDEGEKKAKECGCAGVSAPAAQTRAMLRVAFEDNSFSEIQDKLADTLTKAEAARLEAEKCWRQAAKQAQAK